MNEIGKGIKVLWNGTLTDAGDLQARISSQWNTGLPGFFETMKVSEGRILFWNYHLDRLSRGAAAWGWRLPEHKKLRRALNELVLTTGNDCGRLRLQWGMRFGTERPDVLATLIKDECGYHLNADGWRTAIYDSGWIDTGKSADHKSSFRQVYEKAREWADRSGLDEALMLNEAGFVADGAITNVFWWESEKLYTPPLTDGCVPGVARAWLMDTLSDAGIAVAEAQLRPERLLRSDAVFLTNVIRGVRWVGELDGIHFPRGATTAVHQHLLDRSNSSHGYFSD